MNESEIPYAKHLQEFREIECTKNEIKWKQRIHGTLWKKKEGKTVFVEFTKKIREIGYAKKRYNQSIDKKFVTLAWKKKEKK